MSAFQTENSMMNVMATLVTSVVTMTSMSILTCHGNPAVHLKPFQSRGTSGLISSAIPNSDNPSDLKNWRREIVVPLASRNPVYASRTLKYNSTKSAENKRERAKFAAFKDTLVNADERKESEASNMPKYRKTFNTWSDFNRALNQALISPSATQHKPATSTRHLHRSIRQATKGSEKTNNQQNVEEVVYVEETSDEAEHLHGVLLDAGSSSTKLKVYSYIPGKFPPFVPQVKLEFTKRFKPGLGSFVRSSSELSKYLADIIRPAVDSVPRQRHASTPIYVMATAGLRNLPLPEARALLGNVRNVLRNTSINPFRFLEENVNIISGEEEAVYAWLAVNFLNGFFSSNMTRQDSVGVMEMGGGSMQVAFLPDGPLYQEEFQVYVGRRRFDLYAQTYLSFGSSYITNQVRRRLLQDTSFLDGTKNLLSPCMLVGDTNKYQVSDVSMKVTGTGEPESCEEVLTHILEPAALADCSPKPCAIGDTYQPPVGDHPFYAISAFLYAPETLGAVEEHNVLNISRLRHNAWSYCSLTVPEAVNMTGTKPHFASNDCLMGLYIPLLLTRSLGFDPDTRTITLARDINDRRVDWALGAMVQQLSMTFVEDPDSMIGCKYGDKPIPLLRDGNKVTGSSSQPAVTTVTLLQTLLAVMIVIICSFCDEVMRFNSLDKAGAKIFIYGGGFGQP